MARWSPCSPTTSSFLRPQDNTVDGFGKFTRRAVIIQDEADCVDRKISPLEFDFDGGFTDVERTPLEGTFTYRVVAEEFVDEGDCDPTTSFGTGEGTWIATCGGVHDVTS